MAGSDRAMNFLRRSNLALAGYLTLVFLSGAAVGAFGMWIYKAKTVKAVTGMSRAEQYRQQYLAEMQDRLRLSADQRKKLEEILDGTRKLYRQLSEKHRPEFKAIQEAHAEQVRQILSAEQRVEYEKLRAERQRRREQEQTADR